MKAVEDAHRRSIIEICSKDYSPAQIEKYSAINYSSEIWEKSINDDYHLVVEVKNIIEGFCHAKIGDNGDGHIVGLYFSPVIAGQGIGRKVIEMTFNYLDQYMPRKIVLTGTVTAKPFYEKMGFIAVERKIITIRGAELPCYRMEKVLKEK